LRGVGRRRVVCGSCSRELCNRWGYIPLGVGLLILLLAFCPFRIFLLLCAVGLITLGVGALRC